MDLQEDSGGISVKPASKWDQLPLGELPRKEKRKTLKKLKRKALRKDAAEKERAEQEACLNDPAEQLRIQLQEQVEAEALEKARNDFELHERIWLLNYHEAQRKRQEDLDKKLAQEAAEKEEEENWEYIEDGPAEIIWQGNEIIVQKKRIRVPKGKPGVNVVAEDSNRPISNPLLPQRDAFEGYKKLETSDTGLRVFDGVEQQIPNFGTEQDKSHCPFHIKTGACRFGARCSRAHFYPDKSCTLLMKNMYNGPGLTWEQEEGLELATSEYTDEEVTQHYDEFYDDVHTEFLKFGELVNFKVCRNGSSHLRGNVYVHYMSLDSAIDAYNAINGRFFAAKQVNCEFVAVTRWRGAICSEYMKSRHKNCSRGSACNFLHCFSNPGGEYEWADWDGSPPRSWLRKMDMLFGGSRVDRHDHQNRRDRDHWHCYGHSDRRIQSRSDCRSSSRQHKSHERDFYSSDNGGGTPIRECSGGRTYGSEEEWEQRSDSDQSCDTYDRRVNQRSYSHNRSCIEKSKKVNEAISEDGKIMDRHQIRRKKRHRDHTYEHDNDDEERSVNGVDLRLTGEKHLKKRESCIQFESVDNTDEFKSNDRETMEKEDAKTSHYKKERKRRVSRGASYQLESANIDQEESTLSRSHKHKDYRKISRRNQYSKSPRRSRNHNQSQSGDKGQGMSPGRGQHNNSLPNKSRDSSIKAPERSSAEASFDSLDRWQASDGTQL